MQVSQGRTRTVLIFENFVVKLPRIYLWRAIKVLWYAVTNGVLLKYLQYDIDTYCSPRRHIFKGIWENWQEFCLYRRSRLSILVPTWFSLFGIVNIQKKVEMTTINELTLWCQLCEMTNNEVWADNHTFANPNNFSDVAGKLMIVDYGNQRIHPVLEKFGDKIFKDFDFKYKYNHETPSGK